MNLQVLEGRKLVGSPGRETRPNRSCPCKSYVVTCAINMGRRPVCPSGTGTSPLRFLSLFSSNAPAGRSSVWFRPIHSGRNSSATNKGGGAELTGAWT